MSEYTQEYRQMNFAVGDTAEKGNAWWADEYEDLHFPGAIPMDVAQRMIGWTPVQVPMQYTRPGDVFPEVYGTIDATTGEHDGPKVVLRSDTMAPVGKNDGSSNLFSYWDWFVNGPKRLLDVPELHLGFIGLFKHGAVAAVQIELAKTVVDGLTGVAFRPYLYAATSLDGSMIPQYGRGCTRIVCDNTFSMARNESAKSGLFYGVKQTKNRKVDYNIARDALDIVHVLTDDILAELKTLTETPVTEKQFGQFIDAWQPLPQKVSADRPGRGYTLAENKRDALLNLWANDMRAAPWRGTAFGVSQVVTTYAEHMSTVKGATRLERRKLNMIQGKSADVQTSAMTVLNNILAAA